VFVLWCLWSFVFLGVRRRSCAVLFSKSQLRISAEMSRAKPQGKSRKCRQTFLNANPVPASCGFYVLFLLASHVRLRVCGGFWGLLAPDTFGYLPMVSFMGFGVFDCVGCVLCFILVPCRLISYVGMILHRSCPPDQFSSSLNVVRLTALPDLRLRL